MNQLIGFVIDGKYRVVELLGQGGLGSVYKAEQPELSRKVAVKVMRREIVNDENRLRFEREAKVLATLTHENIVFVYSFGVLPDSSPYMAMELLDGCSLADVIDESGALPWRRFVPIAIQICSALGAAHKAQILHRDLKPQNIMLLKRGDKDHVKVLDFGLSTLTKNNGSAQKLTQTGAMVGSIHYMSPEVCAGRAADERSDVYSLGCTLYELLTGKLPLDANHPFEILHKHQAEMPKRFAENKLAEPIPLELEVIVFKALQKNPDDRFQSMDAMADALRLFSEGKFAELTLSGLKVEDLPRAKKKQRGLLMVTVALVLFFSIAGGVALMKTQRKQSEAAASTQDRVRDREIARAAEIVKEAGESKKTGDLRTAATLVSRAIATLARPYANDKRAEEHTYGDIKVLDSIVPLLPRLHFVDTKEMELWLNRIDVNADLNIKNAARVQLYRDLARIAAAYNSREAMKYYVLAIRVCLENNMHDEVIPLAQEAKIASVPLSGNKLLGLLGALCEAAKFHVQGDDKEGRRYAKMAHQILDQNERVYQRKYGHLVLMLGMEETLDYKDLVRETLDELVSTQSLLNNVTEKDYQLAQVKKLLAVAHTKWLRAEIEKAIREAEQEDNRELHSRTEGGSTTLYRQATEDRN